MTVAALRAGAASALRHRGGPRVWQRHPALGALRPAQHALQPALGRRTGIVRRQRLCLVRASGDKGAGDKGPGAFGSQEHDDDGEHFRETFVRSFLLGIGAGAILETLHVTSKFVGVVGEFAQTHQLAELRSVLPSISHQFSPLFAADHAVAIAFWILFYVMEAGAIMAILTQHGGDKKAAGKELSKLKTLPQLLLPSTVPLVRELVKRTRNFQPGAAAAMVAPRSPRAAPLLPVLPPMQPPDRSAFLDYQQEVLVPPPPPELAPAKSPASKPRSNAVPAPPRDKAAPVPEAATRAFAPSPPAEEVVPGKDVERRRDIHTLPGELADPSTTETQWAHRQRELLNRRLYLKNFWYAAALSKDVKDKPVGVEMLSDKIVLFRDASGKVKAINDVCPHRGAPLHQGWVSEVDGCATVVCPYHGWQLDAEGRVRDVPAAEKKGDWPKLPVVSAYDVEEKGGFVWLFNGLKALPRDARPPIPYVPELDDPEWKPVYGEMEFDCGHWGVFENAIDFAHVHYLHSDSFGNKDAPSIRELEAKKGPYEVSSKFSLSNKPVNAMWEWSKVKEVHVTAKAMLPSTSVISFTLGNGLSFTTFVNTVPINENRTVNRFALIRNLATPIARGVTNKIFNAVAWDKFAHDAMIKILTEDKAMVEALRPDLLQREVNVKADGVQTAFRRLRQEWIELGYGVLPHSGGHTCP